MKCKVARTLLVFVALLFNLLGFLLKTGYAPLADDVLIAGAALEIVGALVLLGKPQASSSKNVSRSEAVQMVCDAAYAIMTNAAATTAPT